jgi:hypothetical protein
MAHPAPSPLPDEAAILNVVNTFLSCIKKRNKTLMLSLILPKGGATLLRRGQPLHMSLEDVVNRIPFDADHPKVLDEQAYNIKVIVDGDIAMAWTPYVFYEDDRLDVGTPRIYRHTANTSNSTRGQTSSHS